MANPYLIRALYGPKPTVSNASSVENSNSDRAQPPRPLSLVERLYGKAPASTTEAHEDTHSERRHIDDNEDTTKDDNTVAEFWAPTRSNIPPLCVQSSKTTRVSSPPGLMQPKVVNKQGALHGRVEFPLERYLPPPGRFFDEFSLGIVLNISFTKGKCWTCWNHKSKCNKPGGCTKACMVCGARHQPGETCPLLYCTFSWFRDKGVDGGTASEQPRQYRPSQTEFAVLLQRGLVMQAAKHDVPIIPNMTHPLVQKFYHNKAAPAMIEKGPRSYNVPSKPIMGRKMLMRSKGPHSISVTTGNQVNASLDPRPQGRFAHTNTLVAPNSNTFGLVDRRERTQREDDVVPGNQDTDNSIDNRLQELEDEVLRLRKDNVLKDREIRKLKSENEKLRGVGHETGNKRARV